MDATGTLIGRQDITAAAERIEPLPASVTRLLSMVGDPDTSLRDITEVIRYDAALTGDVLKRANTTMYAARDTITDIGDAVSRLGSSNVVSLAMARAVKGRMNKAVPAYALDADGLWTHSLAAAVAAEAIAQLSPEPMPPHIGTAALMHDIGKLVIAGCLSPTLIESLSAAAANEEVELFEVEREILGVDHGEISAVVARTWGLPVSIQVALTRHHDLSETEDLLAHAVAASNAVAHAIEETGEDDEPMIEDARALRSLRRCGISGAEVNELLALSAERFQELISSYDG